MILIRASESRKKRKVIKKIIFVTLVTVLCLVCYHSFLFGFDGSQLKELVETNICNLFFENKSIILFRSSNFILPST